jgi:hypothetical protein
MPWGPFNQPEWASGHTQMRLFKTEEGQAMVAFKPPLGKFQEKVLKSAGVVDPNSIAYFDANEDFSVHQANIGEGETILNLSFKIGQALVKQGRVDSVYGGPTGAVVVNFAAEVPALFDR